MFRYGEKCQNGMEVLACSFCIAAIAAIGFPWIKGMMTDIARCGSRHSLDPRESNGRTITNVAEQKSAGYRRIAMVSISISAPERPNPGSGTPVDAPAGSR